MLVRILKYWKYPDLLRQTPGGKGIWKGIQFIVDEPGEADYVILHGHAEKPTWVRCPKGHIWLVLGEPPDGHTEGWHNISGNIDRAYMTDSNRVGEKHFLSYSYLPWWVDKDYDFLMDCPPCEKTKSLSWITSSSSYLAGHRYRLKFLDKVRDMHELDLYGRGFEAIPDKWEGLAPYRYSIAFENHSNSHYWTEKVMDCFLAWTMPIYYGCTNLDNFFPRESYIQLDPDAPDPIAFLNDVINSDVRERNLAAIAEARRRVLTDYNLFNMIAGEIELNEKKHHLVKPKKQLSLILDHSRPWTQVVPEKIRKAYRSFLPY